MGERVVLLIGGCLMALLGLARGAGGLALLVRGASVDPKIHAPATAVTVVGLGLVVVGLLLVVAAIGVLRHRRTSWSLGLWSVILFVIGGAVNGTVLYGRPGGQGTIANVVVAGVIAACLHLGKRALGGIDDSTARSAR